MAITNRRLTYLCLLIAAIVFAGAIGWWSRAPEAQERPKAVAQPKAPTGKAPWTLHDSAPSNPTSLDPIRITDAFTTTVLANVYEGLVRMDPDGRIVPAVAESWTVSADGRTWRFKLRPSVYVHPQAGARTEAAPQIAADDVVFSLNRCTTDPSSMYPWLFADLIKGATEARAAGPGSRIEGIRAPDERTVEIELVRPFPLLQRLVMCGAWVYPRSIVSSRGDKAFEQGSIGTGPYGLRKYAPDDRIELAANASYWGGVPDTAPASVVIHIASDPLAAVEAFRRGDLDVVQLELETLRAGTAIEQAGQATIRTVTANELDYLVLNMRTPPFDDLRVRRALNLAVDRVGLVTAISQSGEPAYGFLPPCSPSYRGRDAMATAGFREDLEEAKRLIADYLREKGTAELNLQLTIDSGELPATSGQFLQDRLQRIPGVHVTLSRRTWPDVLQAAFGGNLGLYRFWWNVVTPGEDVYLLFYMPGQEPPKGFNFSYYADSRFPAAFLAAFSELDQTRRSPLVRGLEDKLIADAVAVPLFHRRFSYLIRKGTSFPVNPYLGRPYQAAQR